MGDTTLPIHLYTLIYKSIIHTKMSKCTLSALLSADLAAATLKPMTPSLRDYFGLSV